MSGEIKFRVWDNYDRLMYYNIVVGENLIIFNYKVEKSFDSDDELDINLDYDIDLDSYVYLTDENKKYFNIMQYTGLKDKNGKEIYEGDVVKDSFNNITGEIISDNGCYWLKSNSKDRFENIIFKNLGEYVGEVLEIIGNVYQNKDLLEEE